MVGYDINYALPKDKAPKYIVLQSLLVGFFMDIKCINYILGTYGFDENSSIMTMLYLASIACILFVGVRSGSFIKPGRSPILLLLYILISYILTISFGGKPYVTLPHLFVFTVASFLIPFVSKIDARLTLKAIMFYPILGITHLSQIFVFVADWSEWVSMGLSYAFYVPIVATIIYICTYFKEEGFLDRLLTLVLSSVNAVYLFMIFQFGSRGPITLLVLLVFSFFIIRVSDNGGIIIRKGRLLFGIILGIAFILSFDQILLVIDSVLENIGVSSHTIDKYISLSAEGDVSHNRNGIMSLAISGFFDSPIWGNGFDCFDQNTGEGYPHNFLLQILYDGGIILLLLMFIPVIRAMKWYYHNCTISEYGIILFMLFAGVAGGLFSGDLWRQPLLWIFFGFVSSNNFILKKI